MRLATQEFAIITLNSGAHNTEKRQSISSGSVQSLKLKIMSQIQLSKTIVWAWYSVYYPQAEIRLSDRVTNLITHLISITSLLLSSYFSFHSDTSLSLATIWNRKQREKTPLDYYTHFFIAIASHTNMIHSFVKDIILFLFQAAYHFYIII